MERAEFYLDAVPASPDGKAVEETEDGDLIIEGTASDFSLDREGEAFAPGAFQKAIQDFLAGGAPLLYHHHNDQQLGRVLDLRPEPDRLYFKAIVPKPAESSPLADVYTKIKRGMMRTVSVRGFFEKAANGLIEKADLAEISVTPLPVNPRALFAVAQKAFAEDDFELSPEDQQRVIEHLRGRLAETEGRFNRLAEIQAEAQRRATTEV